MEITIKTTPTGTNTSTASSEAYTVLTNMSTGLDDVVYLIAEDIANAKRPPKEGQPIQIEADDMREAAGKVLLALKQLAPSRPGTFLKEIESLLDNIETR